MMKMTATMPMIRMMAFRILVRALSRVPVVPPQPAAAFTSSETLLLLQILSAAKVGVLTKILIPKMLAMMSGSNLNSFFVMNLL